jgi:hypothetical protein
MIKTNQQLKFYNYNGDFLIWETGLCGFEEPKFQAGVATAIAAVGLAASIGEYAYSQANQPKAPNLAASSAAMADLQAQLLPVVRGMQATATTGGEAMQPGYVQTTVGADEREKIQTKIDNLSKLQNYKSGRAYYDDAQEIKKLTEDLKNTPEGGGVIYKDAKGNIVPKSKAFVSFAGVSQADIQGNIMKQMAEGQLANEAKYGPDFIKSALEQEKLANPEQFAARQQLYDDIQKQIQAPPTSPVAEELQQRAAAKVAAGSGLTPEEQAMLDTAVKGSTAAQGVAAGTDFSKALTTGMAGTQRQMASAGAGMNWLASGQTPEDIAYRAQQQNLSNLSSYVGGRTPQSQFRALSGAQQGAAPMAQAPALPGFNMGAGQQGAGAGLATYGQQVQAAINTPNPWMAGLSGAMGAANVAGKAGWSPFATQSQTSGVAI